MKICISNYLEKNENHCSPLAILSFAGEILDHPEHKGILSKERISLGKRSCEYRYFKNAKENSREVSLEAIMGFKKETFIEPAEIYMEDSSYKLEEEQDEEANFFSQASDNDPVMDFVENFVNSSSVNKTQRSSVTKLFYDSLLESQEL